MKLTLFPLLAAPLVAWSAAPDLAQKLPPPAAVKVDFVRDLKPLFEASCVKCHAKGKDKGGFSLETREALLRGGDTGPGAVVGKSGESLIVQAVAGVDPDLVMPKKGSHWKPAEVGLLRAWIDQGAPWPDGVTFAKPAPLNLQPRPVTLAVRPAVHPIDNLLSRYFAEHGVAFPVPVDDRTFARRVWLDLIGLLPPADALERFLADFAPDKRAKLVRTLLDDRRAYAEHWLTFWNDLLRNDYKGAGFIDGGRRQISDWLYRSLMENKRYDRFVAELVSPTKASEGFSRGIIWRGNVNASMLPPMQAAQSVSQVFLGVNLKCASCHDSFINDWSLADAYGMAAIYADGPLELVHCDKATGKQAAVRVLYPELGTLDASLPKDARLQRFAEVLTSPKNGRLPRTIVNRLWSRLLGRGLVEPLDDMEQAAWQPELLDWLAEDFVAHGYDVKHTLETICTSLAYQLPTVEQPGEKEAFVFRGPFTKRLSAEQFADAVSTLTGEWARLPSTLEIDLRAAGAIPDVALPKWLWTSEPPAIGAMRAELYTARAKLKQVQRENGDATEAQATLADIEAKITTALAGPAPAPVEGEAARHRVVFRKIFTLPEVPAEAYAAVLASQRSDVLVNGRSAKALLRDGSRGGRIGLVDLKPLLVAGKNVIAIDVSSHTEKGMNEDERKKFPGSAHHLNARSGVAFFARCFDEKGGTLLDLGTDESWTARRNPDGAWMNADFADSDWAKAQRVPANALPVDEGPGLEPRTRVDFANIPTELGPQLGGAVSTAAQPGRIRAALLAADPLQVALDRPNREVVIPTRSNAATTIQALELTNGATLNTRIQRAATRLAAQPAPRVAAERIFTQALGRPPCGDERETLDALLGAQPKAEDLADFLWAMVNLPEFQLIN